VNVTFIPFEESHLPLLINWLKQEHVKKYWKESENEDEVRDKYLRKLRKRYINPQVILFEHRAIGYIQSYEACKIGGGWWKKIGPDVFGIDQLIGDPELIGKGIGPKVIAKFIDKLKSQESVKEFIVDPDPLNKRAIRSFEKVGFVKSEVIVTPSGKALLMRLTLAPIAK